MLDAEFEKLSGDLSFRELRKKTDRRNFTVMTITKGISYSRRKVHRRRDERANAQRDWYHPWLLVLVVGILFFSITDAIFTLHLLAAGAIEANPVMAYFLEMGVSAFIAVKMLLTCFSIVLLTALSSYVFLNRILMSHILTICFIGYMVLIAYELILLSTI